MPKFAMATAVLLALSVTTAGAQTPKAGAAAQIMSTVPNDAATVTHWYKQSVYDPSDSKIGEIMDVLLDKQGKVVALIVGVGGFLGAGEKDVAVPFNAVEFKTKDNNKWYAVMNSTKDALKAAPGLKYDRSAMTWIPEGGTTTTGGPSAPPAQRSR